MVYEGYGGLRVVGSGRLCVFGCVLRCRLWEFGGCGLCARRFVCFALRCGLWGLWGVRCCVGCVVVVCVLCPSLQVFLVLFFACSVGFVQLYIL